METNTDILSELRSLSKVVSGIGKQNLFSVPDGYFETVPATVLASLEADQAMHLIPPHVHPGDVPEGYFDQLADSILNKLKSVESAPDEIGRLSPLLYGIRQANVFEVPAGYFNSLAENILQPVKPRGKVVHMPKRSMFMKYAVAAMITGVTALGIYKYTSQPGGISIESNKTVASLDAAIEKGKNMNEKQFNEALQNLSDADIANYLENNGDVADIAALNNNLDDSKLPSSDDYLLDETTLENYLEELEKPTHNN